MISLHKYVNLIMYIKPTLSIILLIYPIVEFAVAIAYRQDIIFNTNYSINISNWLITKNIFIFLDMLILSFYLVTKRVGMFTYCISQGFVYIFNVFTFIWITVGLVIYANQFELGDFDTPIVIIGVFGGYASLYNVCILNKVVSDYIDEYKKIPLLGL